MLRKVFLVIFASIFITLISTSVVFAAPCGNGICQASQGETCGTCSADCGACPTPTPPPPTPTPTPPPPTPTPVGPTPTPTPQPPATPTPAPTSGGDSSSSAGSSSSSSGNQATPTPTPTPSPPTINLNSIPKEPIENITPVISGVFTAPAGVGKIEISLNDGRTWFGASVSANRFSFKPEALDDGNYLVIGRITDKIGRVVTSDVRTLIIDVLPPLIGGSVYTLGPLSLSANADGTIEIAKDSTVRYVFSTKGGVTSGNISLGNENFGIVKVADTDFFYSDIKPSVGGKNNLIIKAEDGAKRTITRDMGVVLVNTSGKITDRVTNLGISDSSVSVYFFETDLNRWVSWDGKSFGQDNPKKTDSNGQYSFMLPTGRYYIEVGKNGYKKARSEIFNIEKTSLINFDFSLKPLIGNSFSILGKKITFFWPSLTPPDSFKVVLSHENIASDRGDLNLVNKKLPQIVINQKGNVDLSSYLGKPFLLTYLSSWAPDSADQIVVLENLKREKPDTNIIVVFMQDSESQTEALVKRGNYKFDYVIEKYGYSAEQMGITVLPQSFFVNSSGVVMNEIHGLINKNDILNNLGVLK